MSQTVKELTDAEVGDKIGTILDSQSGLDEKSSSSCINFIQDELSNDKRDWNYILNEHKMKNYPLIFLAIERNNFIIASSLLSIKV